MAGNVQIDATGADNTNSALTIGGVISDSGNSYSLTKSDTGRLVLAGQSTFTGGVTITGGSIHVNEQSSNLGGGAGPLGTGMVTLNDGRLIASSSSATVNTIENDITLIGPASGNPITSNGTLTLSGSISGTGGWTKAGNGKIIVANANTFSGNTEVGSGTVSGLNLSHELALQNSTLLASTTGGFIEFDGSVGGAFTLGGLSGDRDLALTDTFAVPITLTIGNNNSGTTHTGILSGDGSIVKVGTGKTTLGGDNTYTGTTTINNGTLVVNGIHSSAGAYTVNSGGTLGGTGTVHSAVMVASGGAVAPGTSIESIDIDSLTLDSGSLLNFELGAPGTSDLINVLVNGGFTANGGTFTFTDAGGLAAGTYTLIDYDGALNGAFSNLTLGGTQPAGFSYMLVDNMGSTSIDLQVTSTGLPGDYNLDGKVDSADYVVWRKNPTVVGGGDPVGYNTWRQNFGNPPGAGSGSSIGESGAVPEPTTCGLLLIATLGAFAGRRSRLARFNS